MAAPTNTVTESFVQNVWSLWTDPNPAAPTSEAATKTTFRNWWNNTTPAVRSPYIRLIADLNEASDHAGQARSALQLDPSWATLDAARQKITALVTDEEKEFMVDYVVRCKSAIRYSRMYRARLDNLWTQLDTNGLGSQTRDRVDQITMQDQALITTWVIRKDTLTTALANYNFVSMSSQPRFITAAILQQNKVSLVCAYDEHGRIVDRVIRKVDRYTQQQWDTTWRWKRENLSTGIPNEYFLGEKCHATEDFNFVKYRHFSISRTARSMTFYTSYCSFGDLESLHKTWNSDSSQEPIPEPLLWYIFHSLAEQCCILDKGQYRTDPNTFDDDWRLIVHRDIKPANIFLDNPDSVFFPQYPVPKMGDFGFAVETNPTEHTDVNPGRYAGAGTFPFFAPEQISEVPDRNTGSLANPAKLLSHTNVWTVGMTMLEMVSGGKLDTSIQKKYRNGPSEHASPLWAVTNYSQELRDLIAQCIRYWPDDRISAEQLYVAIEDKMVNNQKCSQYVLNATAGQQPVGGLYDWTAGRASYKVDLTRDIAVDGAPDVVAGVNMNSLTI